LKEVKAQEAKNPTPPPRNESLRSPAKQALPEHLASPEEIAQALQGLNGKGKGPEKTATAAARLSSAASHGREIVKNQTAPAKTASAASATTSAAAASAPKKAATSNASNTPQALNLVKNLKAGAITDATFLKEVFPLIQNRLGEKAGDIINTRSNQYYHHLGAKARYTDIGAPKETIVSLKSGDLIHANFVSVGGLGKPAIATQAPKAETIKDFVTLIQEQNITTIIDLTNTNDKQTRKIPDYARQPQHGFESTDKTTSELKNSSIEKRELKTGPNQHKVDYLNLTTWPDHGVVDLGTLSNLIAAIGQEHGNKSGGLVIHCTAGVGRTGTVFAGVELSRLAKNGELTKDNFAEKVLDVVAEGRKARGNAFVQAPGQLDLLFDYAQSLVR
jgi:protein tyrosine phosphatase